MSTSPWYLNGGEQQNALGTYTVFYWHGGYRGPDNQVCQTRSLDHARLIAEAGVVLHETGMGPRELAEQNRQLRVLLAGACAGVNLYSDDGELQDNSTRPHIDFLRMSPTELGAAFYERAKAKIALARNETE